MTSKWSILSGFECYLNRSNTFRKFNTNEVLTSIAFKKELTLDTITFLSRRTATRPWIKNMNSKSLSLFKMKLLILSYYHLCTIWQKGIMNCDCMMIALFIGCNKWVRQWLKSWVLIKELLSTMTIAQVRKWISWMNVAQVRYVIGSVSLNR